MSSSTQQRLIGHLSVVEPADRPASWIHLDANANAPTTGVVRDAVISALDLANPSSAHSGGDRARALLTHSRDAVVELCSGAFPEDVIFTSGCTEANNLIVAGVQARGATLITSAVEHPSLLRPAENLRAHGGTVVVLPVGRIRIEDLAAALAAAAGPVVVSVQTGNSETGVLQPIAEIAALTTPRPDALFHSDAAQAFGRAEIRLGEGCGPDVVSVSGHKLHGPMGVGALLRRDGEDRLEPAVLGGDQERGLRAGTEPLALIAGFAAACRARSESFAQDLARMRMLRDRLEDAILSRLPSVIVNGATAPRLPNTSNLRFPGLEAMALVAQLDARGVLASQGSACHSRRPEPSPVLMAMGLNEAEAFSAVRFSLSPLNTVPEVDAAADRIVDACEHLGFRA
jgi:cysteine desulfurase